MYQDVLESSAIAWPNQSMWQRAPHTASKPVPSLTTDSYGLHAHSPRRRARQSDSSGYTMPIFQNTNATKASLVSSDGANLGISTELSGEPLPGIDNRFDWLGHMNTRGGAAEIGKNARDAAARNGRKSSTDTSMPDYVSFSGHNSNQSDNVFSSFPIHEDDDASMGSMATVQAPVNTPTSGQSLSFGSGSKSFMFSVLLCRLILVRRDTLSLFCKQWFHSLGSGRNLDHFSAQPAGTSKGAPSLCWSTSRNRD